MSLSLRSVMERSQASGYENIWNHHPHGSGAGISVQSMETLRCMIRWYVDHAGVFGVFFAIMPVKCRLP